MQKASLKIKKYSEGVSIVDNGSLHAQIFKIMCMAFACLVLGYLVVLSTMVFNIVERKSLEAQARNLSNEVGELESVYLAESEKIDLTFSQTLGFHNIEKEFAVPVSLGFHGEHRMVAKNEL